MPIFMLVFVAFWAVVHIFVNMGKKEALRIRNEVAAEKDAVIRTLQDQLMESRGRVPFVHPKKVEAIEAANQELRN